MICYVTRKKNKLFGNRKKKIYIYIYTHTHKTVMLNNELQGNSDPAVRLLAQESQSGPLLRLGKGKIGPA